MGSGEGFTLGNFIVPNIVRVIKFIRLRWAGHVARDDGVIEYLSNSRK